MKVESYSVSGPVEGLVKQHAIWAYEGTTGAPLVYLQRPKWIANDAQWLAIITSIRLDLPAGLEVGGI